MRPRTSASALRTTPPLLVLHDCAAAAERLTRELEHGATKVLSQRVSSEGAFLHALRSFAFNLDEQSAVAWLRAGAENVVLESNLGRLGPVTDSAMAVRQRLRKLSRRQLEVMRLVTEGLTSREIAAGSGSA